MTDRKTKKIKQGYRLAKDVTDKDAINKLGNVEECEQIAGMDYKTAFMLAGTLMSFVRNEDLAKKGMPFLTYKHNEKGELQFGSGYLPKDEGEKHETDA